MPQHLTMDTGHSWDPEKKASGIKDMQPIYGGKWDLRALQMVEDFENSGHPVFPGVSPLGRGILKKKLVETQSTSMSSIATLTCCTGLFIPRISSVSTEQSQRGVDQILERSNRLESARKTSPEIQIKQKDLKSLVDIPRLPHASGNRMLQNLKDFNSMPFMSIIENLRSTAKFYHPIEKGNHYVTTTLEDDGW